jgi:hypothetical protein
MPTFGLSVKRAARHVFGLTAILTLLIALLASSVIALAQAPLIKRGATVYLQPGEVGIYERKDAPTIEGGFEPYLVAAMMKYKIPLVIVADKDKAEFIIKSNVQQIQQQSWRNSWTEIGATFSMIDPRSSQTVFAYSASYQYTLQGAAEKCVQQLAKFMKKHKK